MLGRIEISIEKGKEIIAMVDAEAEATKIALKGMIVRSLIAKAGEVGIPSDHLYSIIEEYTSLELYQEIIGVLVN